MTKTVSLLFLLLVTKVIFANDLPSCRAVRMADIGWTDVTATTAVAKEILASLGYEPEVKLLSAPVTFAGIKNHDIDVFLGNWMPTQEGDVRQYLDEGSVVQLKKNLKGAVFTLAVPQYVYDAGVRTFGDLANNADKFNKTIYGIEPGNDGNRLILQMINDNAFDLTDWRLVESSEQGMLVEVNNAIRHKDYIVFLAWAPHPMNLSIKLKYLDGGDQYFGKNMGESEVFTVVRRDFAKECPNLAKLFGNLVFSVSMENHLMRLILDDGLSPSKAAETWLKAHDATVHSWLNGVTFFDGKPVTARLHAQSSGAGNEYLKAPLGRVMEKAVAFLTHNFAPHLRAFSSTIEKVVNDIVKLILMLHWAMVIGILAVLCYIYQRSLKLTLLVVCGLLLIVNMGLWVETIKTLVLVVLAAFTSILFGVPLGIMAARRPWFYACLRPMLDLMQTIPTFVYLIPTLMLFGLGVVPGLISTVIFAIAAPIRLTYLGLMSVPKDLMEASTAFGATRMQTLMKIEIPFAMPSIMAGFTQCIMLSLSMVVIAALVGADGLGTPVVRALNTVNVVQGFESGIAIVILAILLDRTLNSKKKSNKIIKPA